MESWGILLSSYAVAAPTTPQPTIVMRDIQANYYQKPTNKKIKGLPTVPPNQQTAGNKA
jgi:hypothetical protein